MEYRVIRSFVDLTDRTEGYQNGYEYHVGDTYPRVNKEVTPERIRELLTNNNRAGAIFIVESAPKTRKKKVKENEES